MTKADYIILGAGASGLMLAYRMANDPFFKSASIVIIDKEKSKGNDRTWCFWEKGEGEWDDILHRTWHNINFGSKSFSKRINISPYSYKMIRSERFYTMLWDKINFSSNISFYQAEVKSVEANNEKVVVRTSTGDFEGQKVFNSLRLNNTVNIQQKYPVLQQHFIGWFIKTDEAQFDDSSATFMDFDIPQSGNTRFMYILPTNPNEALFEYTLFSKDLLPKEEYEIAIQSYLEDMGIKDYEIIEKEQGSIPMTSYDFLKENTENILNIGTAGGWTKASTGYTFRNTTKKTVQLVEFLKTKSDLRDFGMKTRFWFYDMLMLDVLASKNEVGSKLFSSLFKKSKTETIFKFLDEESNFFQELKIMASVPSLNFIKALFRRIA